VWERDPLRRRVCEMFCEVGDSQGCEHVVRLLILSCNAV
jgi:hypothetical protein